MLESPMTSHDRAIGALVGLACGDAVGTTLEFRAPGTFAPIDDMVGGGPFHLSPGEWTDDTSLALCLAESLLDVGFLDPADQLRRYNLWRHHGYLSSNGSCFDIGGATARHLDRFAATGEAFDPNPDQNAAANGSLMRLAAVPIRWHSDPGAASAMSGESSRTTHPATRPVDACRVLGAMTSALIGGAAAAEVLSPTFWQFGPLDPEVTAVVDGSWQRKEPPLIRGTGYCVEALEAALWAVAGADDFRDAILRAANLGDDADTTAAIAGQLAGARWGISGIPESWIGLLVKAERITALATGLFVAGGGVPDQDRWGHDQYVHAWWVEPGRVLAGEYPGDTAAHKANDKVNLLIDAGIRTFIDLTTPEDRLDSYSTHVSIAGEHRQLEVRHLSFPIPDLSITSDENYDKILKAVAEESRRGAVYIHCWGGVGRTGTVIGCLLADQGMGADRVRSELIALRLGTRKEARSCPETTEQLAVIERRAAHTA